MLKKYQKIQANNIKTVNISNVISAKKYKRRETNKAKSYERACKIEKQKEKEI